MQRKVLPARRGANPSRIGATANLLVMGCPLGSGFSGQYRSGPLGETEAGRELPPPAWQQPADAYQRMVPALMPRASRAAPMTGPAFQFRNASSWPNVYVPGLPLVFMK